MYLRALLTRSDRIHQYDLDMQMSIDAQQLRTKNQIKVMYNVYIIQWQFPNTWGPFY